MIFSKTINDLMPFVREITGKTADKALRDMSRALAGALHETNIDIKQYINDYRADQIIDPECLLKNVNDWHDYIKKSDYINFCDVLFQLRPVGLGTPNAMVGEGELMFLFSSPKVGISKEKNKGDLTVKVSSSEIKTVELKGYEFRVFSEIKGTELQRKIAPIAKKYEVMPNKVNRDRHAYEPWGSGKKQDHWKKQFNKIGAQKTKEFLFEILSLISSSFVENDVDHLFTNEIFDYLKLQKEMAKKFFLDTINEWDAFTVLSDTKIKTITTNSDEFNRMIDDGTLCISGDYMRSFQDNKCGLYLRFSNE
jgi:hypothetical protein